MDELRCNNLRCRKSLALEGSSHIFCIDCANALFSTPQICPACETSLTDADDIMQTSLNPHDSYKTSILSGLSPAIILDIASRALNFYTYQVQQEAAFQALITKNAQERISILEAQLNAVTREANAEVALYKERAATAEKDLELERRRVHDLNETHKANAKAYSKLKAQYDKAKQRALLQPGDPNLAQAFSAHPGSSGPGSTPAATRQTFIPAPGNGGHFSRSTSAASAVTGGIGGQQPRQVAGGWGVPAHVQQQKHSQPFGQVPPGSTSRARHPLLEQQNVGHGGGFSGPGGGGGGQNTRRKLNLAAATGGQVGDGLPHFLGQGTRTGAGGGAAGGGARGAFRPAALPGSRHSS
ncbi:hypothetical protein JCM6882_005714 [Rhodosporidiobolus microsporus]